MEDLEYEERAEEVMPKWSSWGGGIVEIKKKYWYESRNRIISILKQLHRAKKQAKRIKYLKAEIQEVANQLIELYNECNETTEPEVYGAILGLHERLEQALKGK